MLVLIMIMMLYLRLLSVVHHVAHHLVRDFTEYLFCQETNVFCIIVVLNELHYIALGLFLLLVN
jgi:hypothetical protein